MPNLNPLNSHPPEGLLIDYITRQGLAALLGIGVRTLARYDALGEGPPRLKLGGRWLYSVTGARDWLRARLDQTAV